MMVPKTSLLLASALLFAGTAVAQNQDHKQFRVGKNHTFTEATLDLQTGVITRGPRVEQKAAGTFSTVRSLQNTDFSGFVGVDSGPNGLLGPLEWVSNADKGAAQVFPTSRKVGGQSKFVQSFVFAYCSTVQDILSGGTGAALTVNFYEGYTPGAANNPTPTGTLVGGFGLSGLPGATGNTGFLGLGFTNCRVVLIRINLGTPPMCLNDTNFGYGFQFDDLDSGGILGGTAVFLGCVQSCSGPGPDSIGQTDNIDVFDNGTGGNYLASFAFATNGTFPANRSGVAIRLEEQTAISTAATISNGSGVNTVGHDVTVVSPPILGGTYGTSIDCSAFTPGFIASFAIGFIPAGAMPVLGGTKGQVLVTLIPGTNLQFVVANHGGGVAARFAPPVPKDLAFYGFNIFEQGFCGGSSGGTVTNLTTLITLCAGSE